MQSTFLLTPTFPTARMKMQEEEPVEKIPSYTPLRTKRLQETFSMGKNSPTHYYFDLWFVFLRLFGHFLDFLGNFAYLSLTLNFWSHRNLSIMIGWITRLVDQIGSRKCKQGFILLVIHEIR
jgi:hypothetical protein